jgi:hypothetical protein
MVDYLNTRVFLVVEPSIEIVAEYQHIDSLSLKILAIIKLKILGITNKWNSQ